MRQKRLRGAASEAGGGCLLSLVAAEGVRKRQASRLVCLANGQTGVAAGHSAETVSPSLFGRRDL